jgi:hypothetical protein
MERETQPNETQPSEASPAGAPLVGSTRKKIAEKPEGILPKILRVTALFVVLGGAGVALTYQYARGQISEALLGAGAQMMMLAEASRQDTPRELFINGQRIHFSSGSAPLSVTALLDRFEQRCEAIDAHLMERVSEMLAQHPEHPMARRVETVSPVLRSDNEERGYVACLDWGSEAADLEELLRRVRRFEQTRDLHDLGDLRYLYAERSSEGSHFVAIWTEGPLSFDALFPESGDAQGRDPEDIPRPPGARRVLTASEVGESQIATIYRDSELEQGGLESFYRRELPAHGWTVLDDEAAAAARARAEMPPALVAMRGDRLVFIVTATDAEGRGEAAIIETGERVVRPTGGS